MYGSKKRGFAGAETGGPRKFVKYKRTIPMRRFGGRAAYGGSYRRFKGLRPEIKTVDSTISSARFDTDSPVANSMFLLNTVARDTSTTGRIGKAVTLKSVAIRGEIYAGSATSTDKITMMLVWIKTPNAAATLPAFTEIMASKSSLVLTNRDNASKFKILKRWDYVITGNLTTPSTGNEMFTVEEYINLKGKKSLWTGASVNGTIGEFEKGALILCMMGDTAYAATTTPLAVLSTRVYFSDV